MKGKLFFQRSTLSLFASSHLWPTLMENDTDSKILTMAEVRELVQDNNKCIVIINNRVYNVTPFLTAHPGGQQILRQHHGKDASVPFENNKHSKYARKKMKQYEIGQLHSDDIQALVKHDSNRTD
ncbi:unnamed protein product [Rotaria sordida]|uniref:Cytochrome b5 heme-binding domain-containing protein n=1 Tax=Rotaria sordida TaxID=392033 RepID=A0A813WQR1_9BILA|nr:unnamed protein product [Rotaria sordida]